MLKAFLLSALLAVPACSQNVPIVPSGWKPVPRKAWGGLNLLQSSNLIDGDAQEATNVLTDNTYLEKRPGNVLLATILSGFPVQAVLDWPAPNGSRYLIAQSSQTVYQTNFSGSPVALSTIAQGFNLTAVPAFSEILFADGFRPLWFWNDVSTGTVTDPGTNAPAPVCTYADFKDNRIWCANLPNGFSETGNTTNGGGSSTVLVSSKNGSGYWAVPANVGQVDDVPNRFDFNPNDGDQITCLARTPWGEFVGKRYSTYVIKGNGNLSYDPRILDPKIGCVDNRSVQMVNGVLLWLAVDGVYGWDGSGRPVLMTRTLDPLMQRVREATFSQGQWATQLQSDWASGTTSSGTSGIPLATWDFTSLPGSVFPSSGTLYDDNTSPSLQNCTTKINPQTSLPWVCGVGFSSDTMVNIDTMTALLSVGFSQVAPSSAGVQVWISSFVNGGNYTTIPTSWTALSGTVSSCINSTLCNSIYGENGDNTSLSYVYTTAASSGASPTNGWNFGAWSFDWTTADFAHSLYGQGCPNAEMVELDFIADRPATQSWNGYGLSATQSSCTGSSCTYSVSLFKSIAGTKFGLGTGSVSLPVAATFGGFSTFTVTRTLGGDFSVYFNNSALFQAHDNTPVATKAIYSNLGLMGRFVNGGLCEAFVSSVSLNGYAGGSIVSRVFDTASVVPLAGQFTSSSVLTSDGATSLTFKVHSSTSPNNDLWNGNQTVTSGQVPTNLNQRYWQYEADFNTTVASETPTLYYLQMPSVSTGNYYSRVDFVGSLITSWRQFGVTENNPGIYNYWVREATYNFSPSDTSISWVAQTANENVNLTVSTPTFAQFRLDSTPLATNQAGASAAEPITGVFLRWDQGQNLPVASATLERRYYLCVTVSTSAAAPDTCLVLQKNGKWVTWSNGGTIGAMGLYNNQIVAADGGTSSKVWQIMQPNVYQDDGQPINSTWVSGDEDDDLPFNTKDYYGALLDIQPVQGSSVTFSYAVSKSTNYLSTTFSSDNGQPLDVSKSVNGIQYGSLSKWIAAPYGYDSGNFIRIKFSDNTISNYFRVLDYTFFVHNEPWSPP